MRCKIAAMAGAIIGWGGAGTLVFTGTTRQDVLAQALLIAIGITGMAWLMVCAYRRPVAESYSYGYEMGRRDAMRDLVGPDGGGAVVSLKRVSEGRRPASRFALDA